MSERLFTNRFSLRTFQLVSFDVDVMASVVSDEFVFKQEIKKLRHVVGKASKPVSAL